MLAERNYDNRQELHFGYYQLQSTIHEETEEQSEQRMVATGGTLESALNATDIDSS